jgi:hypothetical protein
MAFKSFRCTDVLIDAHSVISFVLIQKRILCEAYYAYAELSLHLLAKNGDTPCGGP